MENENQKKADQESNTSEKSLNAFNVLTNKLTGGKEDSLNSLNLPKKVSEYQSLKGIWAGIVLILAGAVLAAIIYKNSPATAILVGIGGLIVGGMAIAISYTGFRQLRKAEQNPNAFNEFQTSTAVEYNSPLATAQISADETIQGWLGPVTVGGGEGISFQLLNKEYNHQSVNTLLITNKQIVAVLLGPQDAPASIAGGLANQVVSTAIQYSANDAVGKNVQYDALYAHKWGDIVSNLQGVGLQNIPQQHLTYAIPYDQVEFAEIKKKMINSGITFHLKNGKSLIYNTLLKEQLDVAQPTLQQHITLK